MTTTAYRFTYNLETPELMPPKWETGRGDLLVDHIDYRLNGADRTEVFTYLGSLTTKTGKARANSSNDHYADPPAEDRLFYERLVRHAFRKYLIEGLSLIADAIEEAGVPQ